ncbi:hypothetical protein B0T26DRAFT_61084 [Lasiosphaeria miniovina]|uniref:Bromo domain-containing protein n=1 Tax=Lasiosphaeria miniovina TaxID=1954250 RepID=A0AA40BHB5_9PEZI|nr:uncharacterized protein B0T26DRAFT_61084 [Lasiosphaeria miniovina]KAK0734235.1 hypothetical protein B0T26DRAFT_61084 [Lasiosphaeria miniovina]
MPISLKTIERKLNNQDFANLSELESYFKRMVTNAKEYYHKGSEVFEDAERVRKALSNYMTKTNPAYKLIPGYSCIAAPIPEDAESEPEEAESADGEDDAESADEDAEGEDDEEEGDEDEEEEEEDDDDEDEEDNDGTRRKIILKRGPGRPARGGATQSSGRRKDRNSRVKADHEYEGVPYKNLNFQQAQEKIVEELIRKPDEDDQYFREFVHLPSRNYKDYFAVITSPLSLKGLQKLVKGIHGRQAATGVSDFKGWAAFEEKVSLLWTNAHYFNEEGSAIYNLATELKDCFEKEVKAAKAAVQEPPQPKIKLKMPSGSETPVVAPKKITIHVGGSRGSAAPSPAPPTQSNDSSRPDGAVDGRAPPPATVPTPGLLAGQPDKAASLSAAGPSPSPSVPGFKHEGVLQQLPVAIPRSNGAVPMPTNMTNGHAAVVQMNGHPPPVAAPPPPPPLYDSRIRAPGRGLADALIPSLLLRTHPSIPLERRFRLEIPAHPKIAQQNIAVHIPGNHSRLQLIPRLAPLEQQQRPYKLFVTINNQTVGRATPLPIPDDPLPPTAMVFDLALQPGTNLIVVTLIAALPRGHKLPNGAECEIEKITINAFMSKPY